MCVLLVTKLPVCVCVIAHVCMGVCVCECARTAKYVIVFACACAGFKKSTGFHLFAMQQQ